MKLRGTLTETMPTGPLRFAIGESWRAVLSGPLASVFDTTHIVGLLDATE